MTAASSPKPELSRTASTERDGCAAQDGWTDGRMDEGETGGVGGWGVGVFQNKAQPVLWRYQLTF